IESSRELALGDGAMPRKYKYLIAMALDAAAGATGGVRSLAEQAMRLGATKEEVSEALRVVYYINGVGSVHSAAPAFKELF
ncbi:MAG: carboxymuconolactone decarboxylase family protein, partial [Chloroflexi bacterium]|nr:carboxymuconolactone decarboxylase family protein [Chloroflexota bacterium]